MDADQSSRLFQPFVRLHKGIPGTAKGTGLGLQISKGIIEAPGGAASGLKSEAQGMARRSSWPGLWQRSRVLSRNRDSSRTRAKAPTTVGTGIVATSRQGLVLGLESQRHVFLAAVA